MIIRCQYISAPIAQLDRVLNLKTQGCRFDSQAGQPNKSRAECETIPSAFEKFYRHGKYFSFLWKESVDHHF